jgi:hypothetical protein
MQHLCVEQRFALPGHGTKTLTTPYYHKIKASQAFQTFWALNLRYEG